MAGETGRASRRPARSRMTSSGRLGIVGDATSGLARRRFAGQAWQRRAWFGSARSRKARPGGLGALSIVSRDDRARGGVWRGPYRQAWTGYASRRMVAYGDASRGGQRPSTYRDGSRGSATNVIAGTERRDECSGVTCGTARSGIALLGRRRMDRPGDVRLGDAGVEWIVVDGRRLSSRGPAGGASRLLAALRRAALVEHWRVFAGTDGRRSDRHGNVGRRRRELRDASNGLAALRTSRRRWLGPASLRNDGQGKAGGAWLGAFVRGLASIGMESRDDAGVVSPVAASLVPASDGPASRVSASRAREWHGGSSRDGERWRSASHRRHGTARPGGFGPVEYWRGHVRRRRHGMAAIGQAAKGTAGVERRRASTVGANSRDGERNGGRGDGMASNVEHRQRRRGLAMQRIVRQRRSSQAWTSGVGRAGRGEIGNGIAGRDCSVLVRRARRRLVWPGRASLATTGAVAQGIATQGVAPQARTVFVALVESSRRADGHRRPGETGGVRNGVEWSGRCGMAGMAVVMVETVKRNRERDS